MITWPYLWCVTKIFIEKQKPFVELTFTKGFFNQKEFLDALHRVYTLEDSAYRVKTDSPINRGESCADIPMALLGEVHWLSIATTLLKI